MCDARGSVTTLRAANYPGGVPPTVALPGCAAAPPPATAVAVDEKSSAGAAKAQTKGYGMTSGVGALIIWFILIFIVTWLLLYGIKPDIVKNKDTGEVDMGKLLLATFVITLIIIIIIWLIKSLVNKK